MLPKRKKRLLWRRRIVPQPLTASWPPCSQGGMLLGRRKGYLCFLRITVTQTRSLNLFCSLDGLHNSLPDLHNNKLEKGHQEKHLLLDKKGLTTPDLDCGAGAQSGRLKRPGIQWRAHTSCLHPALETASAEPLKCRRGCVKNEAPLGQEQLKVHLFNWLVAEQC